MRYHLAMMATMNQPCNTYPARFTLFAVSGGKDEAADIQAARDYIKEYNLTSEDVKIVRDNGDILVVTKREVTLNGKN